MDSIFAVFDKVIELSKVSLSFPPFRFSIFDFFVALAVGYIVVSFIRRLFG